MPALTFRTLFLALLLFKLISKTYLNFINCRHLQKNAGNVPPELQEVVNQATIQKSNSYQIANTVFKTGADWFGTTLLLAFLFTPLFPTYTGLMDRLSLPYPVRGILYFLILSLVDWVIGLPLDYYFHFHLEARFGFNRYRVGSWLLDAFKGLLVNFALMGLILGFTFSIWGNRFRFQWVDVLFGWSAALLLLVTLEYLVPVLIIPIFYKLSLLTDTGLGAKVTALVQKCGFKVRGIFVADESSKSNHANALFAGFGKTKTIIFFDTLLTQYSTEEILGVLAHEIGHGKMRHSIQLMIFGSLQIFLFILLAALFLGEPWPYQAMGVPKIFYSGCFFIFILLSDGFSFLIQPFSSSFSRRLEYQADAFSKQTIGSGAPLVATFKKFITAELGNIHPHPWYEAFYYSHPSLLKRIRALEKQN